MVDSISRRVRQPLILSKRHARNNRNPKQKMLPGLSSPQGEQGLLFIANVTFSGEKTSGGAGNFYGTFGGKIEHFEPVTQPPKPYESPKKNFYTSPGKKGTGYGYLGVTIGV